MKQSVSMLMLSMVVGVLLIADILVFVALGAGHPVPWVILVLLIVVPYFHNKMENRHFVTWRPEYSVGIQAIDEDHKKLLSLINNLQAAVHYHTGDEFEKQALDELVDYTKFHFKREEDLMEKYAFPGLESHRAEHAAMIEQVGGFVDEYHKKGHDVLESIAVYLKEWLIKHINGTDQQYAGFIREKGET
ncbi:MAG: bacteriohemerythrin [Candidatus Sedimenticola sp. 20ELBAFRAG]